MTENDTLHPKSFIGRSRSCEDVVPMTIMQRLASTLDISVLKTECSRRSDIGSCRSNDQQRFFSYNERKTVKTIVIFGIAALLAGCSVYSPDAGHEVVLIEKPWLFGHGGVDDESVKPGRTFTAFTTEGVDVYMQPQKYETEMHDTMTSDGVPISFHAIVVLQVADSVALIKNFGPNWYQNNLEEQFKTMVRQAVRKRGMNETAISTTALDAIDAEIRDSLIAFIKEKGLPVRLITMTVGRANPPDAIKNQRIETATQEQRIQTEQQIKLAENQRKAAEEARAAADNAYRQAIGLSPEQYVQLKRIEMELKVCADGKCTFIENAGAVPTFNVK